MNPKERAIKVLEPWEKYNKSFLDDTKEMLKSRIEAQISQAVMVAVKDFQSPVSGQHLVDSLYDEVGEIWVRPTANDALIWLFTELGELADEMMRAGYGNRYPHNDDRDFTISTLGCKLGDVQLMLCSLALALDLDLGIALQHRINFYQNKYGKGEPPTTPKNGKDTK